MSAVLGETYVNPTWINPFKPCIKHLVYRLCLDMIESGYRCISSYHTEIRLRYDHSLQLLLLILLLLLSYTLKKQKHTNKKTVLQEWKTPSSTNWMPQTKVWMLLYAAWWEPLGMKTGCQTHICTVKLLILFADDCDWCYEVTTWCLATGLGYNTMSYIVIENVTASTLAFKVATRLPLPSLEVVRPIRSQSVPNMSRVHLQLEPKTQLNATRNGGKC